MDVMSAPFLLYITVLLLQLRQLLSSIDTIKIAHLQPNEPSIMHEPHVLRMCAADLKERSILPAEINLQYSLH